MGGKGQIAILAGTIGALAHEERLRGFKDTIAKYPDIEIVDEQRDNDEVERQSVLQNPGSRLILTWRYSLQQHVQPGWCMPGCSRCR